MPATTITDHVEQAQVLPSWQLQDKANWRALVDAAVTRVQLLEDVLQDLAAGRSLDTAAGVQLDHEGVDIGQARFGGAYGLGEADADYRGKIRARIIANQSEGSALDLQRVTRALLGSKVLSVSVVDLYPAAFVLAVGVTSALGGDEQAWLQEFIRVAKPAGVGMGLAYYTDPVFGFSEDPDPMVLGFDDGTYTVGGAWAAYFYP